MNQPRVKTHNIRQKDIKELVAHYTTLIDFESKRLCELRATLSEIKQLCQHDYTDVKDAQSVVCIFWSHIHIPELIQKLG